MTISSGSSIDRTGLVFHFDMENNGKSWRGQPVTNLWANQASVSDLNTFNGWSMPGVPGATSVITTDYGTWNSAAKSSIWKVTVGTGTMQSYASWRLCLDIGLSALGSTRRLQAKVKMLRGSITNLGFHDGGGTGGYTYTAIDPADVPGGVSDKTGWYLLSRQSNWTSTSVGQCIGIGILAQDIEFLVAEPMIALGATSTVPYTPNARSNTEAILDLTGNNTITANSLTYNSDGTFEFNGSSTYASVGNLGNFSEITVELWFNYDAITNYRNPVDCNYTTGGSGTGNIGPRMECNSSGNVSWIWSANTTTNNTYSGLIAQYGISTGNWYHSVFSWKNSGTYAAYINGVNNGYSPSHNGGNNGAWMNSVSDLVIGRGFTLDSLTNRSMDGKIGSVKIYNRALSAAEVVQNFEASRGRYGV